ncbi:MAG: GNAT family N-acetyltransferase [Ignavibacteria bacterium]|nr:GNAT family N-acetyltransferase [Ignavibacteria bacterium]
MKIITIDRHNLDSEHICCAIGSDKKNQRRSLSKKEWMKKRFEEGLVFKRLDQRGKVLIEYMPIETAWKPVVGKNFLVINCLWVSGQFKGKGLSTRLLEECIQDAKKEKKDGIAVVTSTKVRPFLTDKNFFLKNGFESIDTAPPYFELLVMKFNKNAPNPRFADHAKKGTCERKKGLTFIYSNQCPFMDEYVELMAGIARKKKVPCTIQKLKSCKEAQKMGSPFGTLGIYYNGELKLHELMTEGRFEKFVDDLAK